MARRIPSFIRIALILSVGASLLQPADASAGAYSYMKRMFFGGDDGVGAAKSTGETAASDPVTDAPCGDDPAPMTFRVRPRPSAAKDDPQRLEYAEQFAQRFFGKCVAQVTAAPKGDGKEALGALINVASQVTDRVSDPKNLYGSSHFVAGYIDSFKDVLKGERIPLLYKGKLYRDRDRNEGVTVEQFRAIDIVARTIWSEAAICPNQLSAVARVIADRVQSGEKKFDREGGKQDSVYLMPERVATLKAQFSAWRSTANPMAPLESLPTDTQQVRCPKADWGKVSTGRRQQLEADWAYTLDLAKQIVFDLEGFRAQNRWPGETAANPRSIEYFTHITGPEELAEWRKGFYEQRETRSISGARGKVSFDDDTGPGCSAFRLWREKPLEVRTAEAKARREAEAAEAKRKLAGAKSAAKSTRKRVANAD